MGIFNKTVIKIENYPERDRFGLTTRTGVRYMVDGVIYTREQYDLLVKKRITEKKEIGNF